MAATVTYLAYLKHKNIMC